MVGIDEVGRGAIAGPVAVGVTVITPSHLQLPWPSTLQDSKLLSANARDGLFEPLSEWTGNWGVGMASAAEIEQVGITAALALAGSRALGEVSVPTDAIAILDGSHNWLAGKLEQPLRVEMRTKADLNCVSVAAASVLAKVTRDRLMVELAARLEFSAYGFDGHKGYASSAHIDALKAFGPSSEHRLSWLTKILETDVLF